MGQSRSYTIRLRDTRKHRAQHDFVTSTAKRIIIRAGRRGGKTTGVATRAVRRFLAGRRVLYAAPTQDQVGTFWYEVKRALQEPIDAGIFYKNEAEHIIEVPRTRQRIKAKTAWNADTLRGDYADDLILDEWQLMDENAWEVVGAPMLLDNDGDAVFIYTPPSLHSRSASKARDPKHASKMFKRAEEEIAKAKAEGREPRWAVFHFSSHSNPFISATALEEITKDMSALAIRQEIMAEDLDEVPGALWSRAMLDRGRVDKVPEHLARVVVGVDPPGGATECGIVVAGVGPCPCRGRVDEEGEPILEPHAFVIGDYSIQASPDVWAGRVLDAYERSAADLVVGERNYGGDMVENTVRQAARSRGTSVRFRSVLATRGKAVRAEPVVALYEQGRVHHVGEHPGLEDEQCGWVPGLTVRSPNRVDALVWALTELMVNRRDAGDVGVTI